MTTRKQHIESITEGMHAIRRKFFMGRFSKSSKKDEYYIPHSQLAVLDVVMRKENVSITEVAKTLGITNSAATQLVDELVSKGYITRDEGASDRRVLALKLSDKSKKQMEKMKANSSRWFTEMFDCLSDKELAQYAALNKKISDSILKKKT